MGVETSARKPAGGARPRRVAGPSRPIEARARGRALVYLTTALAVGLLLLVTLTGESPRERAPMAPQHQGASASARGGQMLALHPTEPGEDAQPLRTQGEPGLEAPVEARHRFEGRGSIRGEIQVPAGLVPPAELTVVAAPSRVLKGRQHARGTELRLAPGQLAFTLEDLPLGGYDLRVRGPGLDCRPVPVLLCEGAEHPFVVLGLRASGFVDGNVVDELGRPVEDARVTLEPQGSGERRETRTGPSGAYLLEDVPDGEYRLLVGPPERPLAPALELSFRAPSLNAPTVRVPALAVLELEVTDETGRPLEEAHVSGYGSNGGQLEARTDAYGRARVANLPPGRYELVARHASGREGKLGLEVEAQGSNVARMALRP